MAKWLALFLVIGRICALSSAVAALAVYNASDTIGGINVMAVRSSFLALSCLVPGYAALLLVQGMGTFLGLAVPLPDDRLLCALVLAIDGVLAIVAFGTAAAAMSVIQSWHIFVAASSPYRASYGVLAVVSGTWAYVTWLCEVWLAIRHRFARQH